MASLRHKKSWSCSCFPGPALPWKRDHKFGGQFAVQAAQHSLDSLCTNPHLQSNSPANLPCDSWSPLMLILIFSAVPIFLCSPLSLPGPVLHQSLHKCLLACSQTRLLSPLPVRVVSYFGGTATFMAGNYFSDTISAADIVKNKNVAAPL